MSYGSATSSDVPCWYAVPYLAIGITDQESMILLYQLRGKENNENSLSTSDNARFSWASFC